MVERAADGLERAMEESAQHHRRDLRNARFARRARYAVLVLLVASAFGFLLFSLTRSTGSSDRAAESSPLDVGRGLAEGIAEGAVPLCIDHGSPPVVHIPEELGAVERVAVVSRDLRSTLWEVTAGPARLVREVELGTAPKGFRTVRPIVSTALPESGFVVVNGSGGYGITLLEHRQACR